MSILKNLFFWIVVAVFLVLTFGRADGDYIKAFYFVTFLLPVAVGTSYFFNYFLVPKYLLTKEYFRFGLYLFYTLVFSVYLELLVLTLSFIVLANYKYANLNPYSTDLLFMTSTIYFIVFMKAFFLLIRRYQNKEQQIIDLEKEKVKSKMDQIIVRSNRKNLPIRIDDIMYVESLSDYVKIHTSADTIICKEKISDLSKKLPDHFLRVHRSYLVNRIHVSNFNKEKLYLNDVSIPLSRTYGKEALAKLES